MFDPCFHLWQLVSWENAQTRRYHEALVVKNLFNDWEVFCVWGGISNRLGGSTMIPVISLDEAQATLAKINFKRLQRHYARVTS